jgi:hypothetical protein
LYECPTTAKLYSIQHEKGKKKPEPHGVSTTLEPFEKFKLKI